MVHGQLVATGHPDVTDEARRAAGRPAIVDVAAECETRNAELRATRGCDVDLGGTAALVISDEVISDAGIDAHLGSKRFAVWSDGDIAHFAWRGAADVVEVIGSVWVPLHRRTDDLWVAAVKVRDLERAEWHVQVHAVPEAEPVEASYYGAASARVAERVLRFDVQCDRVAVPGPDERSVFTYASSSHPIERIVLVADGEDVAELAAYVAPRIADGSLPGLLLAGCTSSSQDERAARLLPDSNPASFADERRLLFDVILPYLCTHYDAGDASVMAAGFSAGATWAIDSLLNDERVQAAFAFAPTPLVVKPRRAPAALVLAAGTLDPFGSDAVATIATDLRARQWAPVVHEYVTGHDWTHYVRTFPDALVELERMTVSG